MRKALNDDRGDDEELTVHDVELALWTKVKIDSVSEVVAGAGCAPSAASSAETKAATFSSQQGSSRKRKSDCVVGDGKKRNGKRAAKEA